MQGQHRDDDRALVARATRAWALLLGVRELRAGQVLVQPRSNLCGPGRVGILRLGGSVTAVAPTEAAASLVERHINDVGLAQTTDAAVVGVRLNVMDVVGPAYLSYASAVEPVATWPTQVVSRSDLHTFLENGLLPQWRARFAESRRVAGSLGFVEVGAQLNFQLLLD